MILEKLKRIKPFQIIGILIILGLVYGSVSFYYKIQFFKSFANKTRVTSVITEEAKVSSIRKIFI